MSNGFVMVPRWLMLRHPSGNALLVYVALAARGTFHPGTGRYEECRPSIPTVAADTELSETTVRKAIKELLKLGGLEAGGVRRGEDGGQLPTVYRVVFGVLTPPSDSDGGVVQKNTPGGVAESGGNQEPSTKNPSASQRGTHLPKDWQPSDALLQWFVTELVPGGRWSPESRGNCRREHAKFCDYWASASGQNARKRDWNRAWQLWMRRAFERRSPDVPVSAPPAGGPKLFEEMREERTAQRKTRSQAIDAVMERLKTQHPDMSIAEVVRKAADLVDSHIAHLKDRPEELNTRSATGYIDVDVIDIDAPKEVTGHAA